ncbi:uncharacterized protein LOC143471342 [Clavelina lepadiformis]|uniref:uncharacterized protein LOC143471342 n=1 Tax=Clavelina lepadiformis TaxID=159417 RepID=UPI00404250D3
MKLTMKKKKKKEVVKEFDPKVKKKVKRKRDASSKSTSKTRGKRKKRGKSSKGLKSGKRNSKGSEKTNTSRTASIESRISGRSTSNASGLSETSSTRDLSEAGVSRGSVGSSERGRSRDRRKTAKESHSTLPPRDESLGSVSFGGSSIIDVDEESFDRPWFKENPSHKPIVYSCCGFCSLGAGSLSTGILYIGFCVGFLVYRVEEFKRSTKERPEFIWNSDAIIYKNLWNIILIGGMAFASLSMLGAIVLLLASCVFGQKEHYKKMRRAVIVWSVLTAIGLVFNIIEAVYITILPYLEFDEFRDQSTDNINSVRYFYNKEIAGNLPKAWALTGIYLIFFVYLVIVLVSYLRLLKYESAPKVGVDPKKGDGKTGSYNDGLSAPPSMQSVLQSSRRSSNSTLRKTLRTPNENRPQVPSRSMGSRTNSQPSLDGGITFTAGGGTYVNWPTFDDTHSQDSALGRSPVDEIHNNDAESLSSSAVYDLPPTNVYDETPVYDQRIDETQPRLPVGDKKNKVEALRQRADAALELTNSFHSDRDRDRDISTLSSGAGLPKSFNFTPVPSSETYSRTSTHRSNSFTSKSNSLKTEKPPSSSAKKKEDDSKPEVDPDSVTKFFKHLGDEQSSSNPLEEMFRLFGGDLCNQHPENCERYLKSYKDVRSKTSNITSMRDQYEFENLGGNALPPLRKQFPMDRNPYKINTASIYSDTTPFPDLPSRAPRAEPLYPPLRPLEYPKLPPRDDPTNLRPFLARHKPLSDAQRPSTRGSGSKFLSDRHRSYQSQYSTLPSAQNIYYDDRCSTCYGDYFYGDYGSYYSYYGYCPPPPSNCPPPVYNSRETTRSKPPSYNPGSSQFSVMSDLRRPSTTSATPTWFPVNVENDYSVYLAEDEHFGSKRSRSLPNLTEPLSGGKSSRANSNFDSGKPMAPEFTLPSPRQTSRLGRSTSWTSSFIQPYERNKSQGRRPSLRSRSSDGIRQSANNYGGYHTGDLRRRTSHNTHLSESSWLDRPSTRNNNISSTSNLPPRLPPRLPSRDSVPTADMGSSCTFFFDDSLHGGRASSRPSQTLSRNPSSTNSHATSFRLPSRQTSKSSNPYPDKHIGLKAPPSSILRTQELSVHGSRALVPFERKISSDRSNQNLQRSKSVRYSANADVKQPTKQVKFGSTPNLHVI